MFFPGFSLRYGDAKENLRSLKTAVRETHALGSNFFIYFSIIFPENFPGVPRTIYEKPKTVLLFFSSLNTFNLFDVSSSIDDQFELVNVRDGKTSNANLTSHSLKEETAKEVFIISSVDCET